MSQINPRFSTNTLHNQQRHSLQIPSLAPLLKRLIVFLCLTLPAKVFIIGVRGSLLFLDHKHTHSSLSFRLKLWGKTSEVITNSSTISHKIHDWRSKVLLVFEEFSYES